MKLHWLWSAVICLGLIALATPALARHLPEVQQELNTHRLAWQAVGAVDYDFRFQRICFCVPDYVQPGLVHVRGGRINSVEHPVTGGELNPEIYLSIGDLFDEAQNALDRDAIEVRLEYDPVLDYPTSLYIDGQRQIADDEFSYTASGLRVLPRRISDLTGNGFVDFEDLTVLLANWNQAVGVESGNLVMPDSTPVNFADLTVLLSEWTGPGPAGSPAAALDGAPVPEPSSLLLAVIGVLGVCCRRRRQRRSTT